MKIILNKIFFLILIFSLFSCSDPENILLYVDSPISVKKGNTFNIIATIKNTSNQHQKLVSIDIDDNYLDGIAILSTIPDYSDVLYIPIDNTQSYSFNKIVEPNTEIVIKFLAKAFETGMFEGKIDFCINSEFSFLSRSIFTEIY
tara:strand:- start:753 stop:1187 length:435 start_codon:yes stop_codon:yes gene_type:complete